jgi:hypothetical protein
LHNLVNGFRGNCEQGLSRGGNDGLLDGKTTSLAFQGEFRKMVGLREHIQRKIRLPESNFITLIQEDIFYPKVKFKEFKFTLWLYDLVIQKVEENQNAQNGFSRQQKGKNSKFPKLS